MRRKNVFLSLILFGLSICYLSMPIKASQIVDADDAFFIEIDSNGKDLGLRVVGKDKGLLLTDEVTIDVSGKDSVSVKNEIQAQLADSYKVKNIVFYNKDDLIRVTVLGDVNRPGNYLVPINSSLDQLNEYAGLYNQKLFDSSVTVVRRGKRHVVDSGELGRMPAQTGDILLLSLSKKPEPVIKKLNVQLKEPLLESQDRVVSAVDKQVSIEESAEKIPAESRAEDSVQELVNTINEYILQPGDILTISLPGEDGFNKDFIVDRDGTIRLPEVGLVEVANKPMSVVDTVIYDRLSDAFLGLDKLSVHLKEKRLLITVLGFVQNPGEVELPDNANIQMAINGAGGLIDGAQLDKLQLKRQGDVQEFNFKRYLDTGDINLVPELKTLDIIFVPSSPELGNVHGESLDAGEGMDPTEDRTAVKVFGEVITPGSFPYKPGMNLVDALLRAGGVTRYSNVEQIRVIDKGEPVLFNLKNFLDDGDESKLLQLSKGATIFVPKQVDAVQGGGRIVYVMGQVQKPGSFETGANVGFLDVLANAGGPNRYADTRMVRILRSNGEVLPFNLQQYAEGKKVALPKIKPGDAIFIPMKGKDDDQSWTKVKTKKSIKLMGAITRPGRFQWTQGITFLDLVGYAGGPTKEADLSHIRILSPDPKGKVITTEFNMQEFFERGGNWSEVPELVGGSTIIFPELPRSPTDNNAQWVRLPKEQAIYMMGAVNGPGRFAFNEKLGLLDILTAADGPSKDADLSRVRIVHRNEAAPRVSQINLLEYFETGDETLLPKVKPGDSIFIPSIERSWVDKKKEDTVRVLGAVKTSGRYDFVNEMTILDLLAEAGGPTNTAYVNKIIIVNTSCCENQAYTFDLEGFMKNPAASKLPVLRAGDTVYIPDVSKSYWGMFMTAVKDAVSALSLFAIINGL